MRSLLLTVLACAGVSACQTVDPARSEYQNSKPNNNIINEVQRLGASNPGEQVTLSSGNAEERLVTTGRSYSAASGRICKPLFNSNNRSLNQVVCKIDQGNWELQRQLSEITTLLSEEKNSVADNLTANVNSNSFVSKSKPQASIIAEPVAELDEFSMSKKNNSSNSVLTSITRDTSETLWSFSKRVTGRGENWQALAEINHIDDVRKLKPINSLKVPVSLLSDEYRNSSSNADKTRP